MDRKSIRELQNSACEELREEENLNSAAWEKTFIFFSLFYIKYKLYYLKHLIKSATVKTVNSRSGLIYAFEPNSPIFKLNPQPICFITFSKFQLPSF